MSQNKCTQCAGDGTEEAKIRCRKCDGYGMEPLDPGPCETEQPHLFCSACVDRDGKVVRVESPDLFVWVAVRLSTGEVDMGEINQFNDDLSKLVRGWEWRRFRLIEDNI